MSNSNQAQVSTPSQDALDSRYAYIYLVTNLVSGKVYVGQHRHTPGEAWRNYMGSSKELCDEMKRFGHESYRKELLEFADSESFLYAAEAYYIRQYVEAGLELYNIVTHKTGSLSQIEQRYRPNPQPALDALEAQRQSVRDLMNQQSDPLKVEVLEELLDLLKEEKENILREFHLVTRCSSHTRCDQRGVSCNE